MKTPPQKPGDRIDRVSGGWLGTITEHIIASATVQDGRLIEARTLCGLGVEQWQEPCGNHQCRRCTALEARLKLGGRSEGVEP